jgi:hypothetical protein
MINNESDGTVVRPFFFCRNFVIIVAASFFLSFRPFAFRDVSPVLTRAVASEMSRGIRFRDSQEEDRSYYVRDQSRS